MNIDFTKNAFAHILCILHGAYKEMSKKIKIKNPNKSIKLDSTMRRGGPEKPSFRDTVSPPKQLLKSKAWHVLRSTNAGPPENPSWKITGKRCVNETGFQETKSRVTTVLESWRLLGYYVELSSSEIVLKHFASYWSIRRSEKKMYMAIIRYVTYQKKCKNVW